MLVAYLLFAGVMSGVAVLLAWLFATRVFIWHGVKLPQHGVTVFVCRPKDVTDDAVRRALELSIESLKAVWPEEAILKAMRESEVHVLVVGGEKWMSSTNVLVGGEQSGSLLKVNKSLSSMCHELTHFLEEVIDKSVDYEHTGWISRGLWTVDNEFRTKL